MKVLIAKLLTNQIVGRVIKSITKTLHVDGQIIYINSPVVSHSVAAALFWGLYESCERRFIKRYLRSDLPMIELGTSIGVVSTIAAQVNRHRLVCVEANSKLIPLIEMNFEVNNVENFKIINKAIDYDNAEIGFEFSSDNTGSKISKESTTKVPTTTLSELLDSNKIDDFILICDIEGAEMQIMANDQTALTRCQQLIIETHRTVYKEHEYTPSEIPTLLKGLGFNLIAAYGSNFVFNR